ncbi:MAG: carboxypeptidase regulatory-like domain-containing protein [Planctomycetia bacterium]|nr:carboxypeptidase regulatory-like domain-containing protein [Planctomycetia bacterium]
MQRHLHQERGQPEHGHDEEARHRDGSADGGRRPDDAVQVRHYELRWLADAEAAPLAGIVLRADGTPAAAAIVRIDDWWDTAAADASATPAVARTGADGRFRFPRVSPGSWLVRAECPGGEIEQLVTIPPPGDAPCTLRLAAVTTVGLRWMLQTREMVQDSPATACWPARRS